MNNPAQIVMNAAVKATFSSYPGLFPQRKKFRASEEFYNHMLSCYPQYENQTMHDAQALLDVTFEDIENELLRRMETYSLDDYTINEILCMCDPSGDIDNELFNRFGWDSEAKQGVIK